MAGSVSLGGIIDAIDDTLGKIEEISPDTADGGKRKTRTVEVLRGFRGVLEEMCMRDPDELPNFMQIT